MSKVGLFCDLTEWVVFKLQWILRCWVWNACTWYQKIEWTPIGRPRVKRCSVDCLSKKQNWHSRLNKNNQYNILFFTLMQLVLKWVLAQISWQKKGIKLEWTLLFSVWTFWGQNLRQLTYPNFMSKWTTCQTLYKHLLSNKIMHSVFILFYLRPQWFQAIIVHVWLSRFFETTNNYFYDDFTMILYSGWFSTTKRNTLIFFIDQKCVLLCGHQKPTPSIIRTYSY